jgi:uncharacterized protein
MQYIYLHGFASSPNSRKAVFLGDRFADLNINLLVPDLNQDDFSHLTISRQFYQVKSLFQPHEPITLIGSSLGGLTAAFLAKSHPQVAKIILLAPAFEFLPNWLATLGINEVQKWETERYRDVYHYSEKKKLPLHYDFITDANEYQEKKLNRQVPTLIIHGINDETIPILASRNFAKNRPWVNLIELVSDHSLNDMMEVIWQEIIKFCELK